MITDRRVADALRQLEEFQSQLQAHGDRVVIKSDHVEQHPHMLEAVKTQVADKVESPEIKEEIYQNGLPQKDERQSCLQSNNDNSDQGEETQGSDGVLQQEYRMAEQPRFSEFLLSILEDEEGDSLDSRSDSEKEADSLDSGSDNEEESDSLDSGSDSDTGLIRQIRRQSDFKLRITNKRIAWETKSIPHWYSTFKAVEIKNENNESALCDRPLAKFGQGLPTKIS